MIKVRDEPLKKDDNESYLVTALSETPPPGDGVIRIPKADPRRRQISGPIGDTFAGQSVAVTVAVSAAKNVYTRTSPSGT